MKADGAQLHVEGVVAVMHPDTGMGVEFTQSTPQQRQHVEAFIQALANRKGVIPEILVQPEGLDSGETAKAPKLPAGIEDPLLQLFRKAGILSLAEFQSELRKQRGHAPRAAAHQSAL
jgi:hypothetical protein